MAGPPDKKDPPKKEKSFDEGLDDWASAIDEWGDALAFGEESPPAAPAGAAPAASTSLDDVMPDVGVPVPSSLEPPPLAPAPAAEAAPAADPLFGDDATVAAPLAETGGEAIDEVVEIPDDAGVAPPPAADFSDESTRVAASEEFSDLLDSMSEKTPVPAGDLPAIARDVEPPEPSGILPEAAIEEPLIDEQPFGAEEPARPIAKAEAEPVKSEPVKPEPVPEPVAAKPAAPPPDDDDDMPEIEMTHGPSEPDEFASTFGGDETRVAPKDEFRALLDSAPAAAPPVFDDDFYDDISIESQREEPKPSRPAPAPVQSMHIEEPDPILVEPSLNVSRERSSDPDRTPLPVGADEDIFGGAKPASRPLELKRIDVQIALLPPKLAPEAGPVASDEGWLRGQLSLYDTERILHSDGARTAKLGAAAAAICETLGDNAGALERWESALEAEPSSQMALRGLRRALILDGKLDRAVTLFDREAERSTPAERRALAALVAEAHLVAGDRERAKTSFADAARKASADGARNDELVALLGACDVAAEQGPADLAAADAALLTALPASKDAPLVAALLVEEGRLKEVDGQLREAVAHYREALAADPRALGAVFGLLRVATRTPNEADDIEPLGRFGEVLPRGPLRAAVERRLGVLRQRAGDSAAARPLFAAGLIEADNLLTARAIAELELAEGRLDDAAAALGQVVALEPDAGRRADALVDLGRVEEKRGNTAAAAAAFQRAASEYADDPRAARALERTALLGDDKTQEIARHLSRAQRFTSEAPLEWTRAARLLEELGRRDEALGHLDAALGARPGFPPAVALSVEIRLAGGQPAEAAQVLLAAADGVGADIAATYQRDRAARLLEKAGRIPDAVAALQPFLDSGGTPEAIFGRWAEARLHLTSGDAKALAATLRAEASEAEVGDRPRAVALWHQAGLLAAGSDHAEALECQKHVLTIDPSHGPALVEAVAAALRLATPDEIPALIDARLATLESRPEAVVERLRLSLSHAADRGDFAAARQVLDRSPSAPDLPDLREASERLARRAGDDLAIAASLDREAAVTEGVEPLPLEVRFALLVASADHYHRAGQHDRAAERYRAASELRHGVPAAQAGLERALVAGKNYAALADLALGELKEAEDARKKVAAYEKLVHIDGDLRGDAQSALLGWESILETEQSHATALRALERVYLRDGRYAELVSLYDTLAIVAADANFGAVVHVDRARLRRRLGGEPADIEAAVDNDHRLALFKSTHFRPAVRHALARAQAAGDMVQVADLSSRVGELAANADPPDGRAAAVFFTRSADALAAAGRADDAQRRYRAAVERRPGHLPALLGLVDLGLLTNDFETAAAAAEGESNVIRHPMARARAAVVAGALAEDKLSDARRAARNLQVALELEPRSLEVFDRLRRVLLANGDHTALADLYRRRLDVETDGQKLIALHIEQASLFAGALNDHDKARVELRAALGHDATNLVALRMFGDLAYNDQRWAEAADAFIKRARVEKDPAALKDLFFRLGMIYADKEPDAKRAIACFSRVVKADPRDPAALEHLSNLFLKEWDYKGALEATRRLVELTTDKDKRISWLHRIAKIHEEGFKDARHAMEAFRQALEIDPLNLNSIGEMARFFDRQSDVQSMRVHLDRTAVRVRQLLETNAYDTTALHALFRIFNWRRTPDRALMAAGILDSLGAADGDERLFLSKASGGRDPYPGSALADAALDETLFDARIPAGFRHTFRLLDEALGKVYRTDLKRLGIGKGDKLPARGHAVRDIANRLAQDLGVRDFDVYVTQQHPTALLVELTEPLSLVVGARLLEGAHEHDVRFLLARLLKMVQSHMAVPMRLGPDELGALVAGIVRQFVPDFSPAGIEPAAVNAEAARMAKVVTKKVHSELFPFAMECASPSLDLRTLAPALVDTANRAGLLACGMVAPSLNALKRLGDEAQVRSLLRFAVGEEMAELRRQVGTSIG
jgi:tetratricopeptide (TPR) repeat protein